MNVCDQSGAPLNRQISCEVPHLRIYPSEIIYDVLLFSDAMEIGL